MKTNFINKPKHGEPIYRNGGNYNAQHKDYNVDIPFYISQCKKYGGPVLELACGTGRVTIPIAKAGFDISGIDISLGMLNAAKESATNEGVKIDFKRCDIRNFNLKKKFKLIIFPFNAIAHLYDLRSITSCFRCVKTHLQNNGKFIFDYFNPDFKILLRDPSKKRFVKQYADPETGKKIILTENIKYDKKTQINHVLWHYKLDKKTIVEKLNMRIFFPQELDALLILNGFKINHKYGNFDCSEFTSSSPKQIYVCSLKKG